MNFFKYHCSINLYPVGHTFRGVVAFLEKEHERGNIFLIRPSRDTGVKRVEKDEDKLMELYNLGLEDAAACFEDMKRYLES